MQKTLEEALKPFKVKIKTGNWWYKEMVGKVVEVVEFIPAQGRKIPLIAKGIPVYGEEIDVPGHSGKVYKKFRYLNPADVERLDGGEAPKSLKTDNPPLPPKNN